MLTKNGKTPRKVQSSPLQTCDGLAVEQQITVKGEELHVLHVKLRAKANAAHVVACCIDDRVVTTEKLAGKIPGVYGRLSDQNDDFVYSC